MFIIVSRSCSDCGGDIAVRITSEKPTWESHIKDNEGELGYLLCIKSKVFNCDIDGESTSTPVV